MVIALVLALALSSTRIARAQVPSLEELASSFVHVKTCDLTDATPRVPCAAPGAAATDQAHCENDFGCCPSKFNSAEHLIARKALRCTATAWMLIVD